MVCLAPRVPAVHSTKGTEAGEARAEAAGRRHPGRLRLGGSACVRELNVGSLEGMGSSTWSRTERPPSSVAWPSAVGACPWLGMIASAGDPAFLLD